MTEWSIEFSKFLINAHHSDWARMRQMLQDSNTRNIGEPSSCPPLPHQKVFLPLKLWVRAGVALCLPVWGKSMKIYCAMLWWHLYSTLAQSSHPECWRTRAVVGLLRALALLLGHILLLDICPGVKQKPKVLLVSKTYKGPAFKKSIDNFKQGLEIHVTFVPPVYSMIVVSTIHINT